MEPKFSIIIPFYNSKLTLARSIKSVIVQTELNWELILVNDGSTDHFLSEIKDYLIDTRIKLLDQSNSGVCAARNLGAQKAIGEWLVFLDADDELLQDCLGLFKTKIDERPFTNVWKGGYRRVFKNKVEDLIPLGGKYTASIPGTFTIRNDVFQLLGGYNKSLKFSENTELFHRTNKIHKIEVGLIESVLMNYYESENGGSKNIANIIESIKIIIDIHSSTLSRNVKFLYFQILGVNHLRISDFKLARLYFWKSLSFKPWRIDTWLRFLISCLPPLAKFIYTKNITFR